MQQNDDFFLLSSFYLFVFLSAGVRCILCSIFVRILSIRCRNANIVFTFGSLSLCAGVWTTATPFGENCFLTVYNWNVTAAFSRSDRCDLTHTHTRASVEENSGKRNSGDLDVKLAKMKINCAHIVPELPKLRPKRNSNRVIPRYRLRFLIFGVVCNKSNELTMPFMASVFDCLQWIAGTLNFSI